MSDSSLHSSNDGLLLACQHQATVQEEVISSSVVTRVIELYEEIISLQDLSPSPLVNRSLSELVSICIQYQDLPSSSILTSFEKAYQPKQFCAEKLRSACMQAECAMELFWANRIALDGQSLSDFWYIDNYRLLLEYELVTLRSSTRVTEENMKDKKVAFLGSGSLPLTALLLVEKFPELEKKIVLVDRDQACHSATKALMEHIPGLGIDLFEFVVDEVGGTSAKGPQEFEASGTTSYMADVDLVWLGACVGNTPLEKTKILSELRKKMRPGSFVIVRSVSGMGMLLYPELEDDGLETAGFKRRGGMSEAYKSVDVVNCVVIGEVVELQETGKSR